MRESRTYGSVRGALSNGRPYRDRELLRLCVNDACVWKESGLHDRHLLPPLQTHLADASLARCASSETALRATTDRTRGHPSWAPDDVGPPSREVGACRRMLQLGSTWLWALL